MMMMILLNLLSLIFVYNMYYYKYILNNLINLILLILIMNYDLFIEWNNYSFNFMMNNYSFMMIILSLWIFSMILMSLNTINLNLCVNFLMMLLISLILFFMSNNIMMFYFFFEISLVLMFMMIIYWGMGNMRILASIYMMFYTLTFSLPLLLFLLMIINNSNYIMFNMMEMMLIKCNKFLFYLMLLSFLVKIPIFGLHTWLLKAHVEAPVFCSMILASIMLKLGIYGLMRFILIFYNYLLMLNEIYFMILSLIGGIILSIVCLNQIDMKILVAYSSVVHMSILISSLMTFKNLSLYSSYLMMISHGLCSSGLFYMVNLCYKETNSRLMMINKGMMSISSKMSLLWFLLCSSNMSAPLSLNLIGEIFILMILYNWCNYLLLMLMLMSFLSFIYSLYLFSYINHGKMNFYLKIKNIKFLEFFVVIMHWLPLNFMFLNLDLFM